MIVVLSVADSAVVVIGYCVAVRVVVLVFGVRVDVVNDGGWMEKGLVLMSLWW